MRAGHPPLAWAVVNDPSGIVAVVEEPSGIVEHLADFDAAAD
ncbi:hypothetical protein [Streptomyces chiangmaiensis]|uniref:Uncharacterized protein n=1 Tax=Streptomyces chiangmaiensis TaxID=766497 RepID=A0ABU7FMT1_9ACTN|nr:hypothetical protein [Streptomyces chiangmaiensis]MED7825007.1 hypothetical protein [Streptomyces chiangmaiensis]